MNAIRAAGDCDHAGGETATTRTAVSVNAFCRARMSPLLERRAHREVERAEVLAGLAVRVDPVVDADRPERRLPPDPAADPLLQIRQIELRPEPVHVTDIKEPGEPEAERQRDDVLRLAEHRSPANSADTLLCPPFVGAMTLSRLSRPTPPDTAEVTWTPFWSWSSADSAATSLRLLIRSRDAR